MGGERWRGLLLEREGNSYRDGWYMREEYMGCGMYGGEGDGDIFGGLYRGGGKMRMGGREDGGIYVRISYGGLYRGGEEGGEACGA